jgi:hypothetical protein
MRRILLLLTMAAVLAATMATSGTSASAQSPCPPIGPSGGPAILVTPDEPLWAGFVCLDEEDQRFFCPDEFELWLFHDAGSSPPFLAECVELSSPSDSGGTGSAELTQSGEQQSEAGEINQETNVS